MVVKQIKLADLITRLEAANARELYVDVDELEPGVYKVPLSAIAAIIARSDGTVKAGDAKHYMWPGGTLTGYKRKCTNDGINAGNQDVVIEPAADSPVFLHRVVMEHDDPASRIIQADIVSSGGADPEYELFQANISASAPEEWPHIATGAVSLAGLISSDFELFMRGTALAVSKSTTFFVQYAYIGTAPTITEGGPAGAVFSDVS